jgi:hypothetical protein
MLPALLALFWQHKKLTFGLWKRCLLAVLSLTTGDLQLHWIMVVYKKTGQQRNSSKLCGKKLITLFRSSWPSTGVSHVLHSYKTSGQIKYGSATAHCLRPDPYKATTQLFYPIPRGTWWRSFLRHCAASRKACFRFPINLIFQPH